MDNFFAGQRGEIGYDNGDEGDQVGLQNGQPRMAFTGLAIVEQNKNNHHNQHGYVLNEHRLDALANQYIMVMQN